jgi:multicomponent Na+:H+ antiporter subunit D
MRAHLPVLPLLCTLVGALLAPVVALLSARVVWPLAVLAGGGATLAALAGLVDVVRAGPRRYAVGGWPAPWGIELALDHLSAFVALVIAGVGTVVLLTVPPAAQPAPTRAAPAFYALVLVAITGFLGMVASGDLFNVFVFVEIAAISSYALVAAGGGPGLLAAFRYLVLGTVGASFYLLGVGFLYVMTGTLNMADLAGRLPALSGTPLYGGAVAFVVLGLAIKMALFPLHGWLPDAYTHAPPATASVLAPIATKASAYALARLVLYVIRPAELPVTTLLAWAGAAAVLAGGVLAARQLDARRLLAYSSVSQLGYLALGMGLATPAAMIGAYLHVLNHALMKATLFVALAGGSRTGRGPAVVALGFGRAAPLTSVAAVVAALSMVGVPPFGGFFSKWYLLQGAVVAGQPLLAIVIVAGSLLALVYMYRFTESLWTGSETGVEPAGAGRPSREAPAPVLVALLILTAAIVLAGLGNAYLVERVLGPALPPAR